MYFIKVFNFYVNTIYDLVKCDVFVVINFMARALCFYEFKIKTKEVQIYKTAKNIFRQYEFK